jgi:anti-sigma regulatory factor (Ser/Thr protein kinase)
VRFDEKFSPDPESVAEVRRFVRRHTPTDVDLDLAVLLAAELATNAVIHARTPYEVVLEVNPVGLRVDVEDADPTLPALAYRDDRSIGGRGLRMVDAGSAAWGVERRHPGKRVWFAIDRGDVDPPGT